MFYLREGMKFLPKQLKIDLTYDILFNTMFNNLFLLFYLSKNFNQVENFMNTLLIPSILIMLILVSLIFTFNKRSEAIHKVLGLLFVSLFVVLL
jgi:hypothetical protein